MATSHSTNKAVRARQQVDLAGGSRCICYSISGSRDVAGSKCWWEGVCGEEQPEDGVGGEGMVPGSGGRT